MAVGFLQPSLGLVLLPYSEGVPPSVLSPQMCHSRYGSFVELISEILDTIISSRILHFKLPGIQNFLPLEA